MPEKIYFHGLRAHPMYGAWYQMHERCRNPKHQDYKNYGARGITVCERWRNFALFLADVGERPEGMTLDRYPDQDGNYEPNNIRWATPTEQMLNTRDRVHSSQYRGVSWDATRKKWLASMRVGGKTINLGRYVSEINAARIWQSANKLRSETPNE